MVKKLGILLIGLAFLAGCGSAPKTSAKYSVKRYSYYDPDKDPSQQDAIEDLIYSELSKRQQSLLKRYQVPSGLHSLSGVKFDIPMTMNERVQSWIDYFANGSGRKYYERWLSRSTRFVPLQLQILRETGIPKDIIFLSMIESGFNTHAYSTAAASGLWQFIRSTGRLYGLDSDYWIDERRDPEKATRAAARHLRDLYEQFGDWYLAFAAYNAGSGKINRAIEGTGSRNFWEIASTSYIRQETKDYVPKILAAAIIGKSPEKYGFRDVQFQDPIATEKVNVPSPTDIEVLADCAGVDSDLMRLINPELVRNMTPPNRSGYALNIPRGTRLSFQARYARLDSTDRLKNVRYVAERGESLRSIAQDHGVTVSSLVTANPSLGNRKTVASKTTLIVPKAYDSPPPVPVSSAYASNSRGKRLIDLIADRSDEGDTKKSKKKKKEEPKPEPAVGDEGDGEMKVAWKEGDKRFVEDKPAPEKTSDAPSAFASAPEPKPTDFRPEGISDAPRTPESAPSAEGGAANVDSQMAEALEKTDPAESAGGVRVKPSWEEPGAAPKKKTQEKVIAYRVKKGETLAQIAEKHDVTVAQLKEWNNLGKKGLLANQKLVIRAQTPVKEGGGFSLIRTANADEGTRSKKSPAVASKTQPVRVLTHKVRKGDTLHDIARKYDVSLSELVAYNRLGKHAALKPGLVLKIPAKARG